MSLDTAPNFHFFNYQQYLGSNLYLNTSALVFDLALGTEVNLHHIDII
ncbi:MAG: hypothetical protein AB4426_29630 [Xenococcaceae cyanobacterium]